MRSGLRHLQMAAPIQDTPLTRMSLFFCPRSVDFKKVLYASLHRRLDVPTSSRWSPAQPIERGFVMEPVFRPFCSHFLTLRTFVTRSRNFKALARGTRPKPQIAGFGSQRMCPSCRLITSHSKAFCLECGKSFPAVPL